MNHKNKTLLTLAALAFSSTIFADSLSIHVVPPLDFSVIAKHYVAKHGNVLSSPALKITDVRDDSAFVSNMGTLSYLTNDIVEQLSFRPGYLTQSFNILNTFPTTFTVNYSIAAGSTTHDIYKCNTTFMVNNPKGFTPDQDYVLNLYPDHCTVTQK